MERNVTESENKSSISKCTVNSGERKANIVGYKRQMLRYITNLEMYSLTRNHSERLNSWGKGSQPRCFVMYNVES